MITNLIFLGVLIFVIWLMVDRKSKVQEGQVDSNPLTGNEKILIWVICFLNPILGGAILYYGWRKKLPLKAKQANTISFAAFGLLLLIGIIYFIFGGDISKQL
ncbi:MAG TPA: hypothetical protein VI998_02505 [Patescibacteria group bacterium]|nr:hypothetical protein [Patescibacteria group bacterium]